MIEKIDAYELIALQTIRAEQARAQSRLELLSELIALHHNLREGDNVGPDGMITRRTNPPPSAPAQEPAPTPVADTEVSFG